ncbi:hypothetical protein VTL71DRAFT_11428 [Oculimacula yallundae]|uniref:Uncharacterized protein n=1 Tax=Oculimacula yallundae TaxID=86028 RepID=A0ABR4CQF8_9HELO
MANSILGHWNNEVTIRFVLAIAAGWTQEERLLFIRDIQTLASDRAPTTERTLELASEETNPTQRMFINTRIPVDDIELNRHEQDRTDIADPARSSNNHIGHAEPVLHHSENQSETSTDASSSQYHPRLDATSTRDSIFHFSRNGIASDVQEDTESRAGSGAENTTRTPNQQQNPQSRDRCPQLSANASPEPENRTSGTESSVAEAGTVFQLQTPPPSVTTLPQVIRYDRNPLSASIVQIESLPEAETAMNSESNSAEQLPAETALNLPDTLQTSLTTIQDNGSPEARESDTRSGQVARAIELLESKALFTDHLIQGEVVQGIRRAEAARGDTKAAQAYDLRIVHAIQKLFVLPFMVKEVRTVITDICVPSGLLQSPTDPDDVWIGLSRLIASGKANKTLGGIMISLAALRLHKQLTIVSEAAAREPSTRRMGNPKILAMNTAYLRMAAVGLDITLERASQLKDTKDKELTERLNELYKLNILGKKVKAMADVFGGHEGAALLWPWRVLDGHKRELSLDRFSATKLRALTDTLAIKPSLLSLTAFAQSATEWLGDFAMGSISSAEYITGLESAF